MTDKTERKDFMLNKRKSGVLMHISSLPGNTGIGTFGKSAYSFVNFLKSSSQSYWQILPLCPTGYGDSPYQSFSTFAGNEYFIDFDLLCNDNLICKKDYEDITWQNSKTEVDYNILYQNRHKVFDIAFKNFKKNIPEDFYSFCTENSFWLDDFALFMSIKDYHNSAPFYSWDKDILKRENSAIKYWSEKCKDRILYRKMLQYLFFKQWNNLKKYANENSVKIIGDMPIYVAADSSDVWANPKQFCLNQNLLPTVVAGCPPDYFSKNGQLWGNPVYNWDYMKSDNYQWWIRRLEMSFKLYDILRIDHFRGFQSYYTIKAGAKTARKGQWVNGPGMELFSYIKKEMGELPIIAEDLGFLTPEVEKLLNDSTFPGMKVLQFMFDSRDSNNLPSPKEFDKNSVVYTGTHDNDTILGFTTSAAKSDVKNAMEALKAKDEKDLVWKMIDSALMSNSNTCILTMQDILCLDSSARMNTPSTLGNNWKWRMTEDQINQSLAEKLKRHTIKSNR